MSKRKTMANKYVTTLILISLTISLTSAEIQTVNGRINITVGTTAGCGDAVTFMANLVPVYEDYKQYLDIEFVPWGRTRIVDGNMVCQFGTNDCWANRLHRCVLNMLKGNQDAQVHYMACEFTRPRPAFDTGSYICAQRAGLNLIDVDFCMSTTGDALEGPAQEVSIEPMEVINFVPFIVFNGVISRDISTQARQRLRGLICFALADDPSTSVTHCPV